MSSNCEAKTQSNIEAVCLLRGMDWVTTPSQAQNTGLISYTTHSPKSFQFGLHASGMLSRIGWYLAGKGMGTLLPT
jgi:hypothetical protein